MKTFDQLDHAELTHVGMKRSHNQDAFRVQKAASQDYFTTVGHLFLVADGMGGHAVGEKASAKACQDIPLIFAKHATDGAAVALQRAFEEANLGIHMVGQSNPEFRSMGTTATALILRSDGAWLAHVGDSRAYRIRAGQIEQLTYDHSYAWEMARRLGISPDELSDVKKNVIVRSLGPDSGVQVDIEGPHPIHAGDTFLLCSDGLSNQVTPEEIGAITAALSPSDAATMLIELANLRGGPDNITVMIVRIGGADPSTVVEIAKKKSINVGQLLKNAGQAWTTRVPWPITILLVGALLAIMTIFFLVLEIKGAGYLFAFAALTILGGLVSLVLHARDELRRKEEPPERPHSINVYRSHPCPIRGELIERLLSLDQHLQEHVRTNNLTVDIARHDQLREEVTRAMKESDLLIAFRQACKATVMLMQVVNKQRNRPEGFDPKWQKES